MHFLNKTLSKYKSLTKPAKASLWFVICYIIQRGLQFIGMPIFTRIMSTEEYGVYSVFLSWFNIICIFSSLNIYNGTFNKAMVKYEDKRDNYISSIQWLSFFTSIVVSTLILVFNKYIYEYTGYSLKLQILMCVHLILFPSLQYWSQKQRFIFEYKKIVIVTLVNSLASLVLGVIFVLLSNEKSFALIAVTVLIQAIINGVLFWIQAKSGKTFFNKEYWHWSIITAIPLVPHYISEILLGHADRLMINQMCGASQAAIYNIVYQISMVMTILRTGINGSFTPWLFYSMKSKKYSDIRKITKVLTAFMALLTLFFILIGPEILKIVAPPSYYEATVGIPAIMIGCFFIFVYVLYINVEIYYEKNQFVAVASILTAALNVVLNYYCINRFGYISAAYTTMVSYMVMSLMHYIIVRGIIKKNKELGIIFDNRFILICSITLLTIGLLMLKLYDWLFIRWGIIIIMIILFIVKRRSLLNVLALLKKKK